MTIWRNKIMTTEQKTAPKSESELQQTPPLTPTDELSEVNRAAQALVDALKGLAQVKIQSATDLTEEAHHSIDQSVQVLRDKADQNWQAAIHQVENIDERVIKAAKAAWEVLTDPTSEPKS
jgi:transcription initiation factor IIF auxiliary subunit